VPNCTVPSDSNQLRGTDVPKHQDAVQLNFDPPATHEEVRQASLQFVRKLSGFAKPSSANEAAFDRAVEEVASAAHALLDALVTNAPPKDREIEAARARERAAKPYA
jgi:hypothetical protein